MVHLEVHSKNQPGEGCLRLQALRLMVVTLIVLAEHPKVLQPRYQDAIVNLGETVELECQSQGHPHPRTTWVLPDRTVVHADAPTPGRRFLILANGTLRITSATYTDRGVYKCISSNAAGADAASVHLMVAALPPVIQQLRRENITLSEGSIAYLNCSATGAPPPTISWTTPYVHRNGTLDIQSLKVTDAAFLTCIAQNEGGEAKLIIQLDVLDTIEKPRLRSPKMESLSLTVGRTLTLNCSVEGSPAPQVTWVLPGGTFFHKTDGTLVISNPALSEAGNYRCLGRNAGGQVERTVVLSPGRKPEINNRYNSPVSIISGESLQLHCLSASDPVHLTWTLPSGVVLNRPQRAGRYTVLQNGTLSIQQASVYDRGSYTCRTANEYGSSFVYEVLLNLSIKA
uniref:Ig-like domain-containing protein n=1 Tax=Electrophorus electricus TaxID=8005 RepID=A0A4W4FSG4_ELEEL